MEGTAVGEKVSNNSANITLGSSKQHGTTVLGFKDIPIVLCRGYILMDLHVDPSVVGPVHLLELFGAGSLSLSPSIPNTFCLKNISFPFPTAYQICQSPSIDYQIVACAQSARIFAGVKKIVPLVRQILPAFTFIRNIRFLKNDWLPQYFIIFIFLSFFSNFVEGLHILNL
jgi:hypothetical protein